MSRALCGKHTSDASTNPGNKNNSNALYDLKARQDTKRGFDNLCRQTYTSSERKKQNASSKTRDQIKSTRPKLLHSAKNTPVELFQLFNC